MGQVASHVLATANCETTTEPQGRHLLAEAGSIVSDGWIASPVQTFGLTVKPFRKAGAQVYIVQCTIIKLDETKEKTNRQKDTLHKASLWVAWRATMHLDVKMDTNQTR